MAQFRMWAAALVAGLGLTMAAGPAPAADLPKVSLMGASATVEAYHGFMFLGIPLGLYEGQGVKVEFNTIGGSSAAVQMVSAGKADIGYVGMDALILAKAKQPTLPIKAVYLHDRGNIYEIVVPAESDIKTIKDLANKNIGVANLASGAIPAIKAQLAAAGLNPNSSVGLIPVGNGAQALAALKSGRVQALSLFRAQHALLETLGIKFRYFQRDAPSAVLAVNTDFLAKNRAAVIGALRGVVLSTAFAEANPEATVREHWKMFGKPTGLSEDEAMARGKHVLTRAAELWKNYKDPAVKWGDMTTQQWTAMVDFLVEQKLLEAKVPVDQLFTTELIDDINKVDVATALKLAKGK